MKSSHHAKIKANEKENDSNSQIWISGPPLTLAGILPFPARHGATTAHASARDYKKLVTAFSFEPIRERVRPSPVGAKYHVTPQGALSAKLSATMKDAAVPALKKPWPKSNSNRITLKAMDSASVSFAKPKFSTLTKPFTSYIYRFVTTLVRSGEEST